jgi:ribosomal protein S18 acetylase RimI-like enzyme
MIRTNDDEDPVIYYDLEHLISDDQSRVIVAEGTEFKGEVIAVGYLTIRQSKSCHTHLKHGYLGFMFVIPRMRGRGINKAVMDQLVVWGQSKGIEHFYLDVYSENTSAVRAYQKAGFHNLLYEMHAHFPCT